MIVSTMNDSFLTGMTVVTDLKEDKQGTSKPGRHHILDILDERGENIMYIGYWTLNKYYY